MLIRITFRKKIIVDFYKVIYKVKNKTFIKIPIPELIDSILPNLFLFNDTAGLSILLFQFSLLHFLFIILLACFLKFTFQIKFITITLIIILWK